MTINPVATLPPEANPSITPRELGAQDFLKLLISELKNQNPLDAKKSNEMLAQLSQISNVQAMTSMQDTMAHQRTDQAIQLGQSLIGNNVLIADPNGGEITGLVQKVSVDNGDIKKPIVNVTINGKDYPISGLESVLQTTSPQTNP